MTVLIAVASRHGGTRGIADVIADELQRAEFRVAVRDAAEVTDLSDYEAVILGSAVYMGRWLAEARRFADSHGDALRDMPVWLFSSGPIGDPPKPAAEASDLGRFVFELKAKDSRTFPGRLDSAELGLKERVVAKVVGAPSGDFRDWDDVRAWAREIGMVLRTPDESASPMASPIESESVELE